MTEYYGFAREDLLEAIHPFVEARGRALDVGCGEGAMGERLLSLGFDEVWGVEPHEPAATVATTRLTSVIFDRFPSSALKDRGPFDAVFFADSLEHMERPEAALASAAALLADHGRLVVSVPNVGHYTVVRELLRGRWDYVDEGPLDRTHLRFFTPDSLVQLLRDNGMSVIARVDKVKAPRRAYLPLTLLMRKLRADLLVSQTYMVATPLRRRS